MIAGRGHAARRWFGALGVSCALLAAAAHAQAPAAALSLDQLMELLGQRHHGHVAFTEVTRLAIVDRPLQSSGELLYDAPDRLEKRTLAPKQETLLLERGTLTVQRGHRSRVLSLRDYPQIVPFIESIRATLAGDRAALERYFTVQLSGSLAQWTLELTPLDAGIAQAVQRIRIEGGGDALHSVETRQGDGDVSVLTVGASLNP